MPPRPKKKPKAAPTPTYPKIAGKVMQGDSALTATKARELLGWTELAEPKKDDPYDLIYNGVKVRLENNLHNRPIYMSRVVLYMQEIRRGRWRLNGETIVLGRMGTVLNGQHRLIALVLCAIEYEDKPDLYVGLWEHEPVMDVFIAVGIAEDDETVNTLDTAKPRSLTDVLYRSHLLSDVSKAADRKKLARIANYAVRRVWKRTGDQDSHSLKRTHSESMDFLLRHPKLMEAVEFIFEEDEEGAISRYCTPGDAAGMLYLMGASASDPAAYANADVPGDDQLDFSRWDEACDFWVSLGANDSKVAAAKTYLFKMVSDGLDNPAGRMAMLSKAWDCFAAGRKVTETELLLTYHVDDDGRHHLIEDPTVGGIDQGESHDDPTPPAEPSVEEIEARKKEEQAKKRKKKRKGQPGVGDEVWISDLDGEPWQGTIKSLADDDYAMIEPIEGYAGAGNEYETPLSHVGFDEPA